MLQRSSKLKRALQEAEAEEDILQDMRDIHSDIAALVAAERGPKDKIRAKSQFLELLRTTLEANQIESGVIGEIGGGTNSFLGELERFELKFLSIFPADDARYIVADVCNCPHVPSESFDVIFSNSVLEHVRNVHHAAREITRLLKPGGITMHAVPFSYFFHGAPEDYWRLTTTGLEALFDELETIDCFFYAENRRRNNLGSISNRVDRDGGPMFAPDAFGGWRENWTSVYIGRKLPDGAERLLERRVRQTLMDLVKGLTERGMPEDDAIARALALVHHVHFDEDGRVMIDRAARQQQLFGIGPPELKRIWMKRSKNTLLPSSMRQNLMALIAHAGLA
jgi:SAM-dependent methyltransferase